MIVKYRPVLSIVFIFFISNFIHAQIGGDNDYEVLNLSPSARMAAMGGNFQCRRHYSCFLSRPALPFSAYPLRLCASAVKTAAGARQ